MLPELLHALYEVTSVKLLAYLFASASHQNRAAPCV